MRYAKLIFLISVLGLSRASAQSTKNLDVPEITVLGESKKTSPMDYAPTVTELSGQRLRRKQQTTLGETLSRETGVSSSQFGPNSSRPVIRGLDGERIRILQNGTGVLDASAASYDHAVAVDPINVERIEIVRGPAALLYGSSAVGGVVNVVTRRIPETLPKLLEARLDSRYSTVDRGRSLGLVAESGLNERWAFHLDGSAKGSDNYFIPGRANVDPSVAGDVGEVTNSFNRTWNGAAGSSYIFSNGFLGASLSQYSSDYGTVAEKNVAIHLRQRRIDFAGGYRNLGWIESAKIKTTLSEYRHEELELSQVGTTFKNRGNETRLEFKHRTTGGFDGLFGLQANVFRFEALGDEAYLPPTDNQMYSAFVFEEATWADFKPSFGVRFDLANVTSSDDAKFGLGSAKNFAAGSGSVGLIYSLNSIQSVALNTSYTERAPNYQELFAGGDHVATDSFEQGNPNLGKEKSTAAELSYRHKGESGSGSIGAFIQHFDDFVALSPTGQTATSGRAIYNYQAVQARLWGAEAEYRHRFEKLITGGVVEVGTKLDFVKTRNESTGASLPRIPPFRETVDVAYQTDRYRADFEVQRSERQIDTAALETETPAYMFLNLGLEVPVEWGGTVFNLFARANNLLDVEARNHVSFLKDKAPLPGRNLTFGFQAGF